MDVQTASRVARDSFLTLRYRLAGPQGDVVNTFGRRPATLSLGSGQLSPALEERLIGMEEGTHTTLEIPAGVAFGERNPDLIHWLPRREMNELDGGGDEYAVGDVVQMPTPAGDQHVAAVVRAVRADGAVQLDFNHPLAGQPVTFEVELVSVL
jgi:FKBP-type peptidyl-prolyl cis-trans isomerase SlpA